LKTLSVAAILLFGIVLSACSHFAGPSAAPAAADVVSASGAAAARYRVVYSFRAHDGQFPSGPLTYAQQGLYGTTRYGGVGCGLYGCGTVFRISTTGEEFVVHAFAGQQGRHDLSDGANPTGSLVYVSRELFGTTRSGGALGGGMAFEIKVAATFPYKKLTNFGSVGEGSEPVAGLIYADGRLYGTTEYGGGREGKGAAFSIETTGMARKLLPMYTPGDRAGSGANPRGGLRYLNGSLYGTTYRGSHQSRGMVFATNPALSRYGVLYFFRHGVDGANPSADLTAMNGTLYGTTEFGGANGKGTIFKILSPTQGGETTLYSFCRLRNCADGKEPVAGMIEVNGVLYGTTQYGGAHDKGVVFSLNKAGVERVLHSFGAAGDGVYPLASLTKVGGELYGTTYRGGKDGYGTVFALTP
jgi:uncharacterized repeat protein (TIGR03803 family)